MFRVSNLCCWTLLALGCAAPQLHAHRAELRAAAPPTHGEPSADETSEADEPMGDLASYQLMALRESPEVRAAYARWSASVEGITVAGRLPEPVVSYGVFLRSIETRVGPQRQRLAISQSLPWPGGVQSGIAASTERAQAAERAFEAATLGVQERVAQAWWGLWLVRKQRALFDARVPIAEALVDVARRRVELGQATLAEVSRREMDLLRLRDRVAGLAEREGVAAARLRAVVGLAHDRAVPTEGPAPAIRLPVGDSEPLRAHAELHPSVQALDHLAQASELEARRRRAEQLPSLALNADWIELGPARADGVIDSGKDALMVGVSMRLPLATRSLRAGVRAARAEATARHAESSAAALRADADLEAALSDVRDTARRTRLITDELLPRTERALDSLTGVAALDDPEGSLLQTRATLIDLRIEAATLSVDHALAWARLEQIVGHDIPEERP